MSKTEELTDLLSQLEVREYMINTREKRLYLFYKEDFDALYKMMGAEPKICCQRYGSPSHHGKIAFYKYGDWRIEGCVSVPKPADKNTSQLSFDFEQNGKSN